MSSGFFFNTPSLTQYFHIGKIAASFGVKGQLVLSHKLGKKSALKGLEVVFLEMKTKELLPYFVQSASARSSTETLLSLEGVATREAAQKLVARPVWITAEQFQHYAAKSAPLALLGFHLIEGGRDLGEILEIIEQPQQLICRIDWKGKEALIPLPDSFIEKIDKRKKQIHVSLPEGLLAIFE